MNCIRLLVASASVLLAACAPVQPTQAAAGTKEFQIKPGLVERSYRVYQPASYDGSRPVPLVVSLHGGLGTGKAQQETAGWDRLADQHGFIVAYPDGLKRAWNAGLCCGPPMENKVRDVAFMRALVEQVGKDYKIDPARIYGNGFSNGGMLMHAVACEDPKLFTAVATNASTLTTRSCNPASGVPILMIGGRLDERIPWNGGVVENLQRPGMLEVVQKMAANNKCSDTAEEVSLQSGPATCWKLKNCGRNEVSWCGVEGVGHQWIGGKTIAPKLLGANTNAFSSTETMWKFFQRHSR